MCVCVCVTWGPHVNVLGLRPLPWLSASEGTIWQAPQLLLAPSLKRRRIGMHAHAGRRTWTFEEIAGNVTSRHTQLVSRPGFELATYGIENPILA